MEELVMQQKHLYEYSVDPQSQTAGAFVVEFVGIGRRVLEVGCGPGSITCVLATQNQCKVTGIELDPDAIEKASPFCETVIRADLNNLSWPALVADRAPFDVVVAADVLEHLYDPRGCLERMGRLIGAEGFLVISLPHVCHAAVAACLIGGVFEYRDWGLLDRTHIRFFGLANMQTMFASAGLKIVDYRLVIKPPEETEFAANWARLPASLRLAIGSVSHANIYQVVIKAVPVGRAGSALLLEPAGREYFAQPRSLKGQVRNAILRRLDFCPSIKQCVRRLLRNFGVNP